MNLGSHGGRTAAWGNAARQAWSGSPPMLSEVRCASFPDRHFELVEKSLVRRQPCLGWVPLFQRETPRLRLRTPLGMTVEEVLRPSAQRGWRNLPGRRCSLFQACRCGASDDDRGDRGVN